MLFGHACLTARRLIEAGSRVVTVFWDEYGLAGSAWDTHNNHYPRMKEELCPGFDRGWHGLITDLDQRGMLDETLVVCTSEHGRTPKLSTSIPGGGRDHWSARIRPWWLAPALPVDASWARRTSKGAMCSPSLSVPRICWPRCTIC